MPELPEVETIKNILEPKIKNKTITKVDVIFKKCILSPLDEFINTLTNAKITGLRRVGKYMIFDLDNDYCFYVHLRMEGKLYLYKINDVISKYPKVIFYLDQDMKLVFDDMRCFGILKLIKKSELFNEKEIKKLGKEPFDIDDVRYLLEESKNRSGATKTNLLDQTLISGLGNIYVDETLFLSRIYPKKPINTLSLKQWYDVVENASRVMSKAILLGGSTIRSFHPTLHASGGMQDYLKVYGKAGEKCPVCGRTLRFMKTNGRGTTYCPACQKKDYLPLNIAVYGPVGCGKSTVLDLFRKHNYFVFSSDEAVHHLYTQEEVINDINQMFNFEFKDEVNREILRSYLLNNPKDKSKLEKYIWKKIKEEIEELIKENKNSVYIFEVPLLYEAKLNPLFDKIILVDSNKQLANLKKRTNTITANDLMKINQNHILNYLDADYIIHNDNSIKDLEEIVKGIINTLI